MSIPAWFEVTAMTVLVGMLIIDLALVARRPHVPSLRECGLWVGAYSAAAVVFAGLLWSVSDGHTASSFLAGWITEYSLSVDNLFVFVILMQRFAVPARNQQQVLMVGILLALILRGACILVGAAAIERFSWVFYLFGAFLIYTEVQLVFDAKATTEKVGDGVAVR